MIRLGNSSYYGFPWETCLPLAACVAVAMFNVFAQPIGTPARDALGKKQLQNIRRQFEGASPATSAQAQANTDSIKRTVHESADLVRYKLDQRILALEEARAEAEREKAAALADVKETARQVEIKAEKAHDENMALGRKAVYAILVGVLGVAATWVQSYRGQRKVLSVVENNTRVHADSLEARNKITARLEEMSAKLGPNPASLDTLSAMLSMTGAIPPASLARIFIEMEMKAVTLEEYTHGFVHDFNNVITAIYAQMLETDPGGATTAALKSFIDKRQAASSKAS